MPHMTHIPPLKPLPGLKATIDIRFSAKGKQDNPLSGQPQQDTFQSSNPLDAQNAVKYVQMSRPNPTVFDHVKIDGAEVIVFDLETTGVTPKPDPRKPGEQVDDIIEISAIKYHNGTPVDKFHRLVRPVKPIPDEVEKLTGITNAHVNQNGIDQGVAIQDFAKFVGKKAVFVGHNAQGFDIRFVRAVAERLGMAHLKDVFDYDTTVDTFQVAKKFLSSPSQAHRKPANFKLSTVAQVFGIQNPGAHRAENDVTTAAQLYYALVNAMRQDGIKMDTFGDLFRYQFKNKKVPAHMIKQQP